MLITIWTDFTVWTDCIFVIWLVLIPAFFIKFLLTTCIVWLRGKLICMVTSWCCNLQSAWGFFDFSKGYIIIRCWRFYESVTRLCWSSPVILLVWCCIVSVLETRRLWALIRSNSASLCPRVGYREAIITRVGYLSMSLCSLGNTRLSWNEWENSISN